MRLTSVTAKAFGPLKGESLEFGEGMTVIVGDNESGKSSWHSAIYAALCGRRRGPGTSAHDREFRRRFQPWSGDDWLVQAMVSLDDGRKIQLTQDLADNVDCSAIDAVTGRDVSNEIMFDGAPDASRWLGLDRGSFMTTACVSQANLLAVRDGANGLQSYLQQAATSARAGGTAAGAIEHIKAFHKEKVGSERTNAVKPLKTALIRHDNAVAALARATADHAEYLARVEHADHAARTAAGAERDLRECEAVVAAAEAARRTQRADRAANLHSACGGVEPVEGAGTDAIDERVVRALADYDRRPAEPPVASPSVAELDARLAELPVVPVGDLAADPSVTSAVDAVRRAQMAIDAHEATSPQSLPLALPDAEERELLGLAHALDTLVVEVPEDLRLRLSEAQAAATKQHTNRRPALIAIGGVVAVVGLVLLVVGQTLAGAGALLAGAVLAGIGVLPRQSVAKAAAVAELADANAAVRAAEHDARQAELSRTAAEARCAQLGIEPDPEGLRQAAVDVATAADGRRRVAAFATQSTDLAAQLRLACTNLQAALVGRGHQVAAHDFDPAQLLVAADEYVRACADRAAVAVAAGQHTALAAQRQATEQVETRAASDRAARLQASTALLDAAVACGIDSADESAARQGLVAWQAERSTARRASDDAARDWRELQTLLDGRTVEDLQAEATVARQRAKALAVESTTALDPDEAADRLEVLRAVADDARLTAARTATGAREYAAHIASVADAEEALATATAELARVRSLGATLTATQRFLEQAEEKVHRDIAPLLNESLNEHLTDITDGRYTDALVDPENLSIKVCGDSQMFRPSDQLSFGTSEQIYLLLRVALADHLTRGHDRCPLILDDVTVHADAARTTAILEFLHALSAERQVILFSQEAQVADWARERLSGPRDAVRDLAPIAIA